MQQNFLEIFSGPEDTRWAKKVLEGRPVVSTTHQGTPTSPGAPRGVVPPTEPTCTASSPYKFPNTPETLGESTKHNSSRHKFQNHEIQSRDHNGGVHHPHWCLSDDA